MKLRFRLDEKSIWRMVNVGLLICIGMFGGGDLLGISPMRPAYVFTAVAALLVLAFFNYTGIKGRILCLAGGGTCLACIWAMAGTDKCVSFFRSYFQYLAGSSLWQAEWAVEARVMQTLVLAIACYLLGIAMEKEFRLKAAGVLLLLAVTLYCLFSGKSIPHLGIAFIICYIAVFYTEWTQRRWKKEGGRNAQAYMLWGMPFFTAYFLLMVLMPVPEKPYDWRIVKNVYRQVRESFIEFTQNIMHGRQEGYDMSLSGFSEEGSLNGGFKENQQEIMTIYAHSGLRTNVYLIGKVYDTFDGRQWRQLNEDTSKERLLDAAQTLYAAQRYDSQFLSDYLYPANLTISYRYFNTAFLFAPLKTVEVKSGRNDLDFTESGGSLLFGKKKGYGTEYEVSFYQMNADQEAFYRFLEEDQAEDGELLEEVLKNVERRSGEQIEWKDLEESRRMIYENYLGDVSLSEKAEAYLDEVTRNAQSDVEKLRAIEAELSSYTYSREPGELPDAVTDAGSFLDYFLLDSRRGYCNYFATAFVLLARAEGLPARFVQGFCIPSLGKEETIVYANMAHAWPEVYLDDVGWIPFEPTPGYNTIRYTPWNLKNRDLGAQGSGNAGFGEMEEEEKAQQTQMPEEPVPEEESEESEAGMIWMMGAVLLSVALLVLLLGHWISRLRYKKMPEGERFKLEVICCLKILAWIGIERAEGETLEELKNRAQERLGCKDVVQFLEIYEEFLYGDKGIGESVLVKVKEQKKELEGMLKEERKWVYVYYRVKSIL